MKRKKMREKKQNLKDVLKSKLTKKQLEIMPRAFNVIGNIAILQLPISLKSKEKIIALALLQTHKNIKTVVKKIGKVKGKLRKIKTKFLAGEKTTQTIHKENNCVMKLDVTSCYFSPRLSSERLEIAKKIKNIRKKKKKILVMFAGVAPYSLVIAKFNPTAEIYSVELSREASKYAQENVKLNKLDNVKVIQGDVKKINQLIKKYKMPKKYNIIVMPRPQLHYTFLKEAFSVSKKNSLIFFYDFLREKEIPQKAINKVDREAKRARKKVKIVRWKKAGEIAPYKYRVRVDFIVSKGNIYKTLIFYEKIM